MNTNRTTNQRAWKGLLRAVALAVIGAAHAGRPPAEPATIRTDTVIRDVIPVTRGQPHGEPIPRRFDVVILENTYLRITVCPPLGERIVSIIDKITGRECLYQGVLTYSGDAYSGVGGSGGGLHVNHPLYHGGSSYVAPLPYTMDVTADGTAVLTLAYTSYPHLQQTVWRIELRAGEAALRCRYRFENLAPYAMGFNPWINAALPMSEEAQFTLPADWIAGHWFGINHMGGDGDWGHHLRPWPIDADGVDQSFIRRKQWSAAFAYGLTGGYAALYDHGRQTGFARVFDPDSMPGAKAAGAWKPDGWLEIWGAFTHNMEDPRWLGAHETIEADDLWFPFHAIGGMTWANQNGALRLQRDGNQLHCGVAMIRDQGIGAVRVIADGEPILQTQLELRPETPFLRTIDCPAETDDVRIVVTDADGRILMERQIFLSDRPARRLTLPEHPWHRSSKVAEARWQEAFTPLMGWGPWYHPPTTYAQALADDPDDLEAAIGWARAVLKEAGANLFRGRRADTTPETLYQQALERLETLAAVEAPDPRAVALLGVGQFQAGRREAAGATFRRLAGTPDDCAIGRYLLSLLDAGDGDWSASVANARAALALAPDSTLARLVLAIGLLRTEQAGGVGEVLAPVLERNPLDLRARMLMRRAAQTMGRTAETDRLTRDLARLQPLATVQYEAAAGALAALEKGQDLDPMAFNTTIGPALPGREP